MFFSKKKEMRINMSIVNYLILSWEKWLIIKNNVSQFKKNIFFVFIAIKENK